MKEEEKDDKGKGDKKEEKKTKKLFQDTEFFQADKFKGFLQSIQAMNSRGDIKRSANPIKATEIEELNIKCYGYGYYEEPGRKMQSELKKNLLTYLKEAVGVCKGLKILKVHFNGFSIEDETLHHLINIIEQFASQRGRRDGIEFQTRFLRDCHIKDAHNILKLANTLVTCNDFQEIKVIVSGWQFIEPLNNQDLFKLFNDFAGRLSPAPKATIFLKRLKLDFSSWYMQNLEAFNLLQELKSPDEMIEAFESTKIDDPNDKRNRVEEQQRINLRQTITNYLRQLGQKYALENPLPGKGRHYITVTKEYERRKTEQIKRWKSEGKDKDILLRILKDQGSIPAQYKSQLKRIYNEVENDFDKQEKQIEEDEKVIASVNDLEKEISKVYTKFPFDFVMQERVRAFHTLIQELVAGMAGKLDALQECELDMRNWNRYFQMGELKKNLDKTYSVTGGMNLVGGAMSQIASRIHLKQGQQKQQVKTGLKMSFVM